MNCNHIKNSFSSCSLNENCKYPNCNSIYEQLKRIMTPKDTVENQDYWDSKNANSN